MVEDLWPKELEAAKIRTPASILKEQASLLGQKTKNLVEGLVTGSEQGGELSYSFFLVAPALNNYRYLLFTMSHDIRMYPLSISVEEEILAEINPELFKRWGDTVTIFITSHAEKAENEAEFLELLKKIFSATKTKQLIAAMLSQST